MKTERIDTQLIPLPPEMPVTGPFSPTQWREAEDRHREFLKKWLSEYSQARNDDFKLVAATSRYVLLERVVELPR